MFHTISKIQEPIHLRESIDNCNKNLRVGLRSITYTVGWYNIKDGDFIAWRQSDSTRPDRIVVPPGLYSFKQLKELLESLDSIESVAMNKENGLIKINIASGYILYLSKGLMKILGLNDQRQFSDIVDGDHPVNFAKKVLYVYLEQINSKNNIVDGLGSNLLACIGLEGCHSFGSIHTVRFVKPEYKLLQNSTINEWKIIIKDEDNNILDNNNLSVYISIEIK